MNFFLTFLLVTVSSTFALAQNTSWNSSIVHHSSGGASVATVGTFSSLENISSLSLNESFSAGVSVQNSYFLKELTLSSFGLVYSNTRNAFGLQYSRIGHESYNENKIGLAYAKPLSERIHLGVKVNYLSINQGFYGNTSLIDVAIGLRTKLSPKTIFATHIFNPLSFHRSSLSGEQISTASGLRAGISYLEKELTLNLELESSTQYPLLIKSGVLWDVNQSVNLRAGVIFPSNKLSGGIGLRLKQSSINFYYAYEILLNSSAGIGINYEF